MAKFTFGVNFGNEDLIFELEDILEGVYNGKYKNKVHSIYGAISDKRDVIGGARETNRISGTLEDLEWAITIFEQYNVKTNYVCNSFSLTPNCIENNRSNIIGFFILLKSIGVNGVIIANPLLIDYVKDAGLKVIISTVLHVNNLGLLDFYIKKCVDIVVLSLYSNRDFEFLKAISNFERSTKIELMVNEICLSPCPWRMQHYIQESSGEISNAYFPKCYAKMKEEFPYSILCSNFIRPEDIGFYFHNYNIDRFKITGRTFNYKKMLNILRAYLKGEYHGNLLDLFPIVRGNISKEKSDEESKMFIDNSKLRDFISYFPKDVRCEVSCFRFGGPCQYCKEFHEGDGRVITI